MKTFENERAPPIPATKTGPTGIGGWMIIPIIGMFITIALTGFNILNESLLLYYNFQSYINLIGSSDTGNAFKFASIGSMLGTWTLVITAAITLYLILRKRKLARKFAGIHYVFVFGMAWFGLWAEEVYFHRHGLTYIRTYEVAIFRTIWASLWLAYFHFSRRVKNTFTH